MPRLPRQQGKGRRLLCFCRQAELLTGSQLATQRLETLRKHGHQCCVARAATGNDVVHRVPFHLAGDKTFIALRDTLSRERGCCSESIFGFAAATAASREKLRGEFASKLLAPRSPRRLQAEICCSHRRSQNRREHCATRRRRSIAIKWFVQKLLGKSVYYHVARPGIEGLYRARRGSGRNRGQVRNAADVLQHASPLCVGEYST